MSRITSQKASAAAKLRWTLVMERIHAEFQPTIRGKLCPNVECQQCATRLLPLHLKNLTLKKFNGKPWEFLITARYGRQCHYCGSRLDNTRHRSSWFTVDHIVPRAFGGTTELSNMVPCCSQCNTSKGPRPYEWMASFLNRSRSS